MSHSNEQNRKKAEARAESLHQLHNSAVDGPHHDMKTNEHMYSVPKESEAEKYEMEGC